MNSKEITNLKIKYETIKLLRDHIGENLDHLGYGFSVVDFLYGFSISLMTF